MSAAECIDRIGEIRTRIESLSPAALAAASSAPKAPDAVAAVSFSDALSKALEVAAPGEADKPEPTGLVDAVNQLTKAVSSMRSEAPAVPALSSLTSGSPLSALLGGSSAVTAAEISKLFGVTL